jgi:hypothetical protein
VRLGDHRVHADNLVTALVQLPRDLSPMKPADPVTSTLTAGPSAAPCRRVPGCTSNPLQRQRADHSEQQSSQALHVLTEHREDVRLAHPRPLGESGVEISHQRHAL